MHITKAEKYINDFHYIPENRRDSFYKNYLQELKHNQLYNKLYNKVLEIEDNDHL